jgi:hypothetical protein
MQETAKTAYVCGVFRQVSTYPERFDLTYREEFAGSAPTFSALIERAAEKGRAAGRKPARAAISFLETLMPEARCTRKQPVYRV